MNSVISKEVKVLKLGRIKFKDAWKRQEEKFNSIIDTKINNRKTESNKKTKNYIGVRDIDSQIEIELDRTTDSYSSLEFSSVPEIVVSQYSHLTDCFRYLINQNRSDVYME